MTRLILLLLLFSNVGWAQKVTVQGILRDSAGTALPSATVLLLSAKDSALVNFAPSNQQGFFELKNVARQSYLLKVTYVGFRPLVRELALSDSESPVDLGVLTMETHVSKLDELMVTSEKAPVTIKKDTIEFNATSFKTKENAVVEDLLKKLPGVEVDNDGTIRAQGEQVRRVTVDGKAFFGNDPKIATRNLPADAIEKIQVYDRKSDQAAFTGIDDGQREKTINLELKEEKRKGAFGTLTAGLGNEERFQSRASLNKFQKGKQFSFLGMANNVNEQGFGMDEYMNFTGGSQRMLSGGGAVRIQVGGGDNESGVPLAFGNRSNGLLTSYAGGLNFNRDFTRNTELNSSYFYNQIRGDVRTDLERINYLPGGDQNRFLQNAAQASINHNHRLNATLDHKLDSMNSLKLMTGFTFNSTRIDEKSESSLRTGEELLNSGSRFTVAEGDNATLNTSLLWRHRFARKGRTLSASMQFNYGSTRRDGSLDATVDRGQNEDRILQTSEQDVENLQYGSTLSYTEPLGSRKYLEVNYTFRENINDFERSVYDVSGDEGHFNTALSNAYRSAFQYHRGGVNFRLNRSKYNITVGSHLQQTYLKGTLQLQETTINKSFQNVLPVVRMNYEFTNTRRVNLDYETSVQEPTIQQLQPVVDNSDPFNLYVGNPDLRPAYSQNLRLNFTSFNPGSFISLFAFVQAAQTSNAITVSQSFNGEGVRISRPVNVSDNKAISGNVSFGIPVNVIKSRFNISTNLNFQRGMVVVNDVENETSQNTIGGRLRYEFRYNDVFDIAVGANVARQTALYEFDEQADQLFFNNAYTAEGNLKFLKNYSVSGSFEYLYYENKTTPFEQAVPLLNLSLSRFLLKAKSGELKVGVVNLLDRNVGYSQTASLNYFERQRTNNLGRYFMVSFTYALNKQLNPMGARAGGNMIRIMR